MATNLAITPNMVANCPKCGRPDNADRKMVACDRCDVWYHFMCAGVTDEIANVPWLCVNCTSLEQNNLDVAPQKPTNKDNVLEAISGISSLRSHSTTSVMMGLRLLDEDFQLKQTQLAAEKELQEKKLRLEEEFAKKQRELQDEHVRKRRELLALQEEEGAVGGRGSVVSNTTVKSNTSAVRRWLEEHYPEAKRLQNDPRGAIPKVKPPTKQTPQIPVLRGSPLRNPTVPQFRYPYDGNNNLKLTFNDADSTAAINGTTSGLNIPLQYDDDLNRSFFQLEGDKTQVPANNVRISGLEFPKPGLPRTANGTNIKGTNLQVHEQQKKIGPAEQGNLQLRLPPAVVPQHVNETTSGALVPYGLGRAGGLTAIQLAARHAMPKKLPTFNGNPEEWPFFISNFTTTTEACGYSNAENLARLQECLKGKALERVRSRLLLPQSVPEVIETLRKRFGRPELLLEVMLRKVEECEAPKLSDLRTFSPFSEVVEQLCDHLEATNQAEHLNNPTLLKKLILKLPPEIALKWAQCTRDIDRVNLSTFAEFASKLTDDVDGLIPIFGSKRTATNPPAERRNDKKGKERGFLHAHGDSIITAGAKSIAKTADKQKSETKPKPCKMCSSTEHKLWNCDSFKKLDIGSRLKTVEKWKLCHVCLNDHGDARCRLKIQCNIDQCTERHNPLLHDSRDNQKSATEVPHNTHQGMWRPVIFRFVPVTLYHCDRSIETTAFIDEGSSLSLVESSIADHLRIKGGMLEPLRLTWTSNVSRIEKGSKRIGIQMSARGAKEKFHVRLRTVSELKLPSQSIDAESFSARFRHLRDLPLNFDFGQPRLLLGLDNLHLFAPIESRIGRAFEPIAIRSKLGWTTHGPVAPFDVDNAVVNAHATEEISNQDLHDLMREYFSVEDVGVNAQTMESEENRHAREILEKTTIRVGDRYETGLLWRSDDYSFPDSYPMSFKRLLQFEKKLAKNPVLAEQVLRLITEYQRKGYAHKATKKELDESDPRKVWYIPLNVVINPKKPSKIRLVWDAAAIVNGVSLNGLLLKGPDLLVSLIVVLCCFRERRVAFGGDLEEMYHQIRIRPADKQAQRFLFRSDPSMPPDVYIMDVATFGATSSPTSAQFVKNKNADEHAHQFPEAAAAIKHRHYVDDYFDSADSEEEAIERARAVKLVHSKGGFHIRNWVSNSTRFLEELGEPGQKQCVQFTSDKHTNLERILGITWNPAEDVFSFSIPTSKEFERFLSGEARPTKSIVLKFLMSFFDPLGLVAPFLVHGKILMQDVWRSGCDWKDVINDECYTKWLKWIEMLPRLELLKIPRSYFGSIDMSTVKSVELHVFTDASEKAYGCAAFLRIVHAEKIHCALVMGKTKVAPLKLLSIPRLELEGALLGAKIANTAETCHTLPITRRLLWTDSTTVMSWIQSDPGKYKKGIAFKLTDLLSLTKVTEWHWVPTRWNVADDLTKRGRWFSCSSDDRWLCGPEFLHRDEEHWPHYEKPSPNTTEELRATFLLHHIPLPTPLIDVSRISRWKILLRTIACIFRFASNCQRKARGLPIEAVPAVCKLKKLIVRSIAADEVPLKQEECRKAENYLWRQAQGEAYPDEVKTLLRNKNLPPEKWHELEKSSSLKSLSPFFDDADVLRMEGRTESGDLLTIDQRFPIILPKNHDITTMLLEYYHHQAGHGRNETAVNEIRQHYHIDALRSGIAKVAKNCQRCKVRKCQPRFPRMAPLPKQRVSPYLRPFSFVGVDYCGPLVVTVGRRSEKRWIVVFTCFNTRAIHLEVAHSLTTQSCLMAIKRFLCKYGLVKEIFSDNGTNLRGADNQGVLIRKINVGCADVVVDARLKWNFNPPSAPHMGGVWERMVRSVKETLYALDEGCRLTDEVLLTTLAEVSDMINSRPLTYQPLDPDCPEALTPNHFLRVGPDNGELIQNPTTLAQALKDTYQRSQYLADLLWKRWLKEFATTLNRRPKWQEESIPLKPGDVVFVTDENHRKTWSRGIVLEVIRGTDKRIRRAVVKTQHGKLTRPVTKLAPVDVTPRSMESASDPDMVPVADPRAGELLPTLSKP